MAMYHLSVKYISRKKGQSIVAAAAYRSGEMLYDKYYGEAYDYTKKRGIVYTVIILPSNALHKFYDRETLWNAVEYIEKRKDSRLAREVEISLPLELTLDEHIGLARGYVTDNFVSQGMCADISIHDKGVGNPHAHILLTTRAVSQEGFSPKKNRDWDKRENVSLWRKQWEIVQNREFERKGLKITVSHESYVKRGIINREPSKYLGRLVTALERIGIPTDRSDENQAIKERNEKREEQKRQSKRDQEQSHERSR